MYLRRVKVSSLANFSSNPSSENRGKGGRLERHKLAQFSLKISGNVQRPSYINIMEKNYVGYIQSNLHIKERRSKSYVTFIIKLSLQLCKNWNKSLLSKVIKLKCTSSLLSYLVYCNIFVSVLYIILWRPLLFKLSEYFAKISILATYLYPQGEKSRLTDLLTLINVQELP